MTEARRAGSVLVALLLGAGLAARIAAAALRHPPIPNPDGYVDLGVSVAHGGGLADEHGKPTALREPFYPLVLGAAFKAFGARHAVVAAVNVAAGVLTLWLMFLLGRDLFGEGVGLAALAVGALYPPFLYYAAEGMRECVLAAAVAAAVVLLVRASRCGCPRWGAAAGAACAAAALTKATIMPYGLVVAPVGLWWSARRDGARAARLCGAYLAVFVCLFGLWPLRNLRAVGKPVWGNTEGLGGNLYQYLVVPQQEGGTEAQTRILGADPVYRAAPADPVARDAYLTAAALRLIRARPLHFARLFCWRLAWDEWRLFPRRRSYDVSYGLVFWSSLLTDGWLIPLGLAGMFLAAAAVPGAGWPAAFVLLDSAAYAAIFTIIRYRFDRMPLLIVFACYALARARRYFFFGRTS